MMGPACSAARRRGTAPNSRAKAGAAHSAEKAMDGEGADPLGERRGAGDVQEEEEALFRARAVVAADDDVAQGALADETDHLQHEDGVCDEENEGCDQQG